VKQLFIAIALLLIAVSAFAQSAIDGPKAVQTPTPVEGTPSSNVLTQTFGSNVTVGNKEIVDFAIASGTLTGTVSSSLGNTCVQAGHLLSASGPFVDREQWYCDITTGGSETISVTLSAGGNPTTTIALSEWSGLATGAPETSCTAKTGNGGQGPTIAMTGSCSTSSRVDLLIGGLGLTTTGNTSIVGYLQRSTDNSNPVPFTRNQSAASPGLYMSNWVTTATDTAYSFGWNWSVNGANVGVMGAYASAQQPVILPHGTPTTTTFTAATSAAINVPNAASTDCTKILLCSTGILLSPSCTGNGCTCTDILGPTTYNTTASKTMFLCSGCTGNPTCTFGITATGIAGSKELNRQRRHRSRPR
jgi:hypothetical protein